MMSQYLPRKFNPFFSLTRYEQALSWKRLPF